MLPLQHGELESDFCKPIGGQRDSFSGCQGSPASNPSWLRPSGRPDEPVTNDSDWSIAVSLQHTELRHPSLLPRPSKCVPFDDPDIKRDAPFSTQSWQGWTKRQDNARRQNLTPDSRRPRRISLFEVGLRCIFCHASHAAPLHHCSQSHPGIARSAVSCGCAAQPTGLSSPPQTEAFKPCPLLCRNAGIRTVHGMGASQAPQGDGKRRKEGGSWGSCRAGLVRAWSHICWSVVVARRCSGQDTTTALRTFLVLATLAETSGHVFGF